MLSDKGYEILQLINQEKYDEILDMNTFAYLESCGYIACDGRKRAYVTPKGDEACKDFEMQTTTKENADTANLTAKRANKIAICSALIAVGSLIATIFIAILK